MKKILPIALAIIISLIITMFGSWGIDVSSGRFDMQAKAEIQSALVSQTILGSTSKPNEIYKVYEKGQLIGVLSDYEAINTLLDEVYQESYSIDFPNSNIGLGEDIYITTEMSFHIYDNADEEILFYLKANDRFSVEVFKIEFSNGAVIYVNNLDHFEQAKEQYLLNFISKDAYNRIKNKQEAPDLIGYTYREVNISVLESTIITRDLASRSKILKDVNEIVYFLSYGYGTEINKYKVVEFDTVEGVGFKTGLSAQQIVTINSDRLRSINQLLEVGMELNVTYFNSPINVVVTREVKVKEVVYPRSTQYVPDSSIREGLSRLQTREEYGSKDVVYKETYINGVLVKGEEVSSVITKQPVREVIRVGTMIIPGIGSGKFRWPVDNPRITCGWYCYAGHTAIDIINRYNRYGPVYAADRGVIAFRGYHSAAGYYVIIDHNNGYRTQYNHLSSMAYFPVGVAVNKGEQIGRIGVTGLTTGPHVHFVVSYNRVRINPCRVLGC